MKNNYVRNEIQFPHSPDVIERDTADNGFSKGWGMNFIPIEKYWIDCHNHIQFDDEVNVKSSMMKGIEKLKAVNVRHLISCTPIMITKTEMESGHDFLLKCLYGIDMLLPYLVASKESKNFSLLMYMAHTNPDVELLEEAYKHGLCGVKLHNAPIIYDNLDPELWLSKEWDRFFQHVERLNLPVLWHVTQRLTDAPYGGVGRNTYWKEGWEKGTKFTNEDLLQVFLKVVGKYPGIRFIGAHQLHVGWERLSSLLNEFTNLFTDTSVGCIVRKEDRMYEIDREYIRQFFIEYNNRILYGTDLFISDESSISFINSIDAICDVAEPHIRFIKQLKLPFDVLEKISHVNAETLFGLCKNI